MTDAVNLAAAFVALLAVSLAYALRRRLLRRTRTYIAAEQLPQGSGMAPVPKVHGSASPPVYFRDEWSPYAAGCMEAGLQTEAPTPTGRPAEDMLFNSVTLRATRSRQTRLLVIDVGVSRSSRHEESLVVEEVTTGEDYVDGAVLVCRFEFGGKRMTRTTTPSVRKEIAEAAPFKYVVLMYGPASGPLKFVTVAPVDDI